MQAQRVAGPSDVESEGWVGRVHSQDQHGAGKDTRKGSKSLRKQLDPEMPADRSVEEVKPGPDSEDQSQIGPMRTKHIMSLPEIGGGVTKQRKKKKEREATREQNARQRRNEQGEPRVGLPAWSAGHPPGGEEKAARQHRGMGLFQAAEECSAGSVHSEEHAALLLPAPQALRARDKSLPDLEID